MDWVKKSRRNGNSKKSKAQRWKTRIDAGREKNRKNQVLGTKGTVRGGVLSESSKVKNRKAGFGLRRKDPEDTREAFVVGRGWETSIKYKLLREGLLLFS